jgi:hypothetical protein
MNLPNTLFTSILTAPPGAAANLLTITTGADTLILTQDASVVGAQFLDRSQDVSVFADHVTIHGAIDLPGRSVRIVARVVDTDGAASISVNGDHGAAPPLSPAVVSGIGSPGSNAEDWMGAIGGQGGPGAPGAVGGGGDNGKAAGSIAIYAGSFGAGCNLALNAIGGTGGAGQGGQPGQQGGQGGVGAKGPMGNPRHWKHCANGGVGGTGGTGGTGGPGGTGGHGGNITVCCAGPLTGVTANVSRGGGGAGGPGAAGGAGGPGGPAGEDYSGGVFPCSMGSTGQQGTNGIKGGDGYDGVDGVYTPLPSSSFATLSAQVTPSFLAMALQRAALLYLSASPARNSQGFTDAADILNWIHRVTEFFDTADATNPGGLSDQQIQQLIGLHRRACGLTLQLSHRLDYYGHYPNFVPRVSVSSCQDVLNQMLPALKSVEDSYKDYFNTANTQQQRWTSLQNSQNSYSTQMADLQSQIDAATTSATGLLSKIQLDEAAVNDQKAVLLAAIETFKRDIERQAGPNCDITGILKVVDCIGSISGNSTIKTAASIGSKVDSLLPSVIPSQYQAAAVSHTVKAVTSLEDSVTTLQEQYQQNQGLITPDDPHAYKLLATQTRLNQILQPYMSLATAQAAKAAMDLYVKLVLARNADILKFNAQVSKLASLTGALKQAAAQLAQVQASFTQSSNPLLPELVTFMSRLYNDARADCVYQLYMTSQALSFFSLNTDYSVFYNLLSLDKPGQIDHSVLDAGKIQLLTQLQAARDSFGNDATPYAGIAVSVTKTDNPAAIQSLIAHNSIYIPIPPATPQSKVTNTPFVLKANVRVSSIHLRIPGAKTGDGTLRLTLSHLGTETLVDTSGNVVEFEHNPISVSVNYVIANSYVDVPFGDVSKAADFAAPGPFTTWHVAIDPNANVNLDLSDVTSVSLEFSGASYAFTMAATA